VAAGAAVAVGRPHLVSEPLLGKEWQCSRTVFFVTTCDPVRKQNSRPPPALRYARCNVTRGVPSTSISPHILFSAEYRDASLSRRFGQP
jgi:hypothetical protein